MGYTGPMTSIFADIRSSCARVAERASHVRIRTERIADYAASLPLEEIAAPELDPESHYLGHGEATLAFILTLDAINFGSGYFPHLRKLPGKSGYFTVATRLTEYFQDRGGMTTARMAGMDVEQMTVIMGQDPTDDTVTELMSLFARAVNQLGRYVLEEFDGSFAGMVEAAGGSAGRLVEILSGMEFYRDERIYAGERVLFYKRAQLTAADLALAFPDHPWGAFTDLDRLTIFADNLVPHVLRLDGVLDYDTGLTGRIDAGELLMAGSEEEVEIRACGLWAVELIREAIGAHAVTSMGLDYLLWNRGQQPHYKQTKPRHRCRTVHY